MAHVQPHRVPEFSVSGSGEDASVFWEPSSSTTDPFATQSPSDTILPAPSPLGEFPTPPSSPTGSLGGCGAELSVVGSTIDPTNNDKKSCSSRTRYGGPALEHLARVVSECNPYTAKHKHKTQAWKDVHSAMKKKGYFTNTSYAVVRNKMGQLLKYHEDPDSVPSMDTTLSQSQKIVIAALLDKVSENQRVAAAMNDEQKESERKKADADRVGGEVIRAQASRSTTRQSRKREIDQVDDSDKENVSPRPTRSAPAAKRIRREKTGTEWETVLDVVKFGEEQRSRQNEAVIEEMRACTAVLEKCSERYLQAVTHTLKQ
ncbi:hypothetical protein DEU56DRAFT_744203 [Suillus clintonianus]|uniref:uncharacterized protein n=1 Tax=Suillus clintonianus TaxID=1904413 RepID=UPI001B881F78|nr:uncharacterized protein DEU56DRAFT_744203 [Suillus clintonianus]KAG2124861.1 hypothetical protein DEU56DRAFT_744203 [Suillus clintonianus]